MEPTNSQTKLEFSEAIIQNLDAARKWAMFLSIAGFVFIGIMVVFGFSIGFIFKAFDPEADMPGFPMFIFGFFYLVMAVIYFFPILFLFRFSFYTKKSILENDNSALVVAFNNLKSHYAFIGILMVIGIGMYLILAMVMALFALIT
jgi:hypothetical protein